MPKFLDSSSSSAVLERGFVTYSNEAKHELLGVDTALIDAHGAVSEEVARGLAESVRERVGATIGVGITGIAGPDGGSPEKPVGTVHIAVAGPAGTEHKAFSFPGDRARVRWQASQAALDMVRRALMPM